MVCQFLLYNKVNQLYIYICSHISSFLHLPPSHPPYPSRWSQSTELISLCYAAASHQLFYIWQCIYTFDHFLSRPFVFLLWSLESTVYFGKQSFIRYVFCKIFSQGTSLVVQWIRLRAPNAGGRGSIPGQRTRSRMLQLKIPHAATKDPTCGNKDPRYCN